MRTTREIDAEMRAVQHRLDLMRGNLWKLCSFIEADETWLEQLKQEKRNTMLCR